MCLSWDNAFSLDSWPHLKSFSLCLLATQRSQEEDYFFSPKAFFQSLSLLPERSSSHCFVSSLNRFERGFTRADKTLAGGPAETSLLTTAGEPT